MMQFSKYIRKGFTIIHVSDWNSLAAYDEKTETLVLVVVNTNDQPIEKSFDLTAFLPLEQRQVEVFRTSPSEPHLPIPNLPSLDGNQLSYSFPGKSVTTFKISSARAISSPNLVLNGDFESGRTDGSWFLLYGQRQDNAINGNYVRRGSLSGYVDYTESDLSLMQNVTVRESKRYFLSAWLATSGPSTKFGILVNGQQGPELTVERSKGYQLYGLSVDARESDVLSIYVYSKRGSYNAQIDDVELH